MTILTRIGSQRFLVPTKIRGDSASYFDRLRLANHIHVTEPHMYSTSLRNQRVSTDVNNSESIS
jgi:hypothetical protein